MRFVLAFLLSLATTTTYAQSRSLSSLLSEGFEIKASYSSGIVLQKKSEAWACRLEGLGNGTVRLGDCVKLN